MPIITIRDRDSGDSVKRLPVELREHPDPDGRFKVAILDPVLTVIVGCGTSQIEAIEALVENVKRDVRDRYGDNYDVSVAMAQD